MRIKIKSKKSEINYSVGFEIFGYNIIIFDIVADPAVNNADFFIPVCPDLKKEQRELRNKKLNKINTNQQNFRSCSSLSTIIFPRIQNNPKQLRNKKLERL
jgi:hypothetical protein